MNKSRSPRFMPFFLALSMIAGILIGTFYANHFSGNRLQHTSVLRMQKNPWKT